MEQHKKNRIAFRLPRMGQRIIKTALGVFICLLIYILRGYQGMVIQSAIAVIICMQPYVRDSRKVALNRVKGTVMGGIWGLLFLLLMMTVPVLSRNMLLVYFLMAAGVAAVLYSCVLFGLIDSAALAAIVFLCVIIAYPDVEAPLQQTLDRIIDTIVGVIVAVLINSIRLPRVRHPEKVFFLRLKDIAADRYSMVPSGIMIELNRLYDEGARICLETRWAPAFMISQMSAVRINMPIIVMDGAALYDMRENAYYEIMDIPHADADRLREILRAMGICICVFAVRTNTMQIFYDGELSAEERTDYELMHRTPFRNYMDGMYKDGDRIVAVRFLVSREKADEAWERIRAEGWLQERFRVVRYEMPKTDGHTGIYFYCRDTSMETMEERLLKHMRENGERPEAVRITAGRRDYVPERDAHLLLHEISRQYMTPGLSKTGPRPIKRITKTEDNADADLSKSN